jgi:hypothetical protein
LVRLGFSTISFFATIGANKHMRHHANFSLTNFSVGLVSLVSISAYGLINFSNAANAQSFPNDSLPVATPTNAQYLVYLPNAANLKQAKILAPDAFLSRLETGEQIVQLGRFNNLNLAQRRASQFSQAGLNPQIQTVQSKFTSFPSAPINPSTNPPINSIPTIPNNPSVSVVPIPVESIPIPNSRVNEPLPNVPNADFPNSNPIEIIRSPQPIPAQPVQPVQIPTIASQGNIADAQLRYFVIIPTGLVSELQRVQAIAPNAQLRSSYRGTYIEVQGYPDRNSAETLNLTVRRQGFDSRVVFF